MLEWKNWPENKPEKDGQLVAVHVPGAAQQDVWPARFNKELDIFEAGYGWFEKDEIYEYIELPEPPSKVNRSES